MESTPRTRDHAADRVWSDPAARSGLMSTKPCCLPAEASLLVSLLHVREVLEPGRRPVVADSHRGIDRVVRVVDSVEVRLEEMKYVGVLEQDIRHRVPVEVIGMPGQRSEGRLIKPGRSILNSRWCVLQDQVERELLCRARRQRPLATSQIGGQVIVGPGCTAPPRGILA